MDTHPQFIESICFQKGAYQLTDLHQQRVDRTFDTFFPDHRPPALHEVLPRLGFQQRHKVRIVYSRELTNLTYEPYLAKPISSFRVIPCERIDYRYKYSDRAKLQELYAQKGTCDDIIITQNNLVTDCYYANLAFFDGIRWYTPKTKLLAGVKQAHLISQGMLQVQDIKSTDIKDFEFVSPINALLDLGEIMVSTTHIHF